MELLKSYERGRTKSDEKNKTSIGLENATLRHFLIGNEERGKTETGRNHGIDNWAEEKQQFENGGK